MTDYDGVLDAPPAKTVHYRMVPIERYAAERALADDLAAALAQAREDMDGWAAYASEYFQTKWDLAGDLAKCDAGLARYREARHG
jgi:hypothetical protein